MTELSSKKGRGLSYIGVHKKMEEMGVGQADIVRQLAGLKDKQEEEQNKYYKRLNRLFTTKELFDRTAYGLGANQFLAIFFFLTGASAFLVGVILGLKDLIGGIASTLLHHYSHLQTIGKKFIANAGILFGFSFLGLVLAIRLKSPAIYALFTLIGSVGVVAYGELYGRIYEKSISYEKKSPFLKKLTRNGLFITVLALIISGYVIEKFSAKTLQIMSFTIPLSGYFIIFEVAAILFILAGFVINKLPEQEKQEYPFKRFLKEYFNQTKSQQKIIFQNKKVKFLYLATILTTIIQTLGATFYGYYIYTLFQKQLFGGFLNIAIIFGIAILVSFLGPVFTRFVQQRAGLAPMFVFGTLLIGFMPLVLLYNQHFPAIVAAASAMVIGASILGVAQGLLARKLLLASERRAYFQSQSMMMIIPFFILIPLSSYLAQQSFTLLFQAILLMLGLAVIINFILVLVSKK